MATLNDEARFASALAGAGIGVTRRRVLRALGLGLCSISLAGCGWNDSYWRQKITVSVNTPAGVAEGSAVTSIEWSENRVFKDGARWHLDYTGEAVVVNIGDGKHLFALLRSARAAHGYSDDIGRMGPISLGMTINQGGTFKKHIGKIDIKPELYPMLVAFGDLKDPASVFEVKPGELDKHFGVGVSLASITLEITNEPVTEGKLASVLPWLNEYDQKEYRLNGEKCVACPVNGPPMDILGASAFTVRGGK
jgi:hypothetical protein